MIEWHRLSEEKPDRADLYLVYDPETPRSSCYRIDDWICLVGVQIDGDQEPFFWDDEGGTITHWAELTSPCQEVNEETSG